MTPLQKDLLILERVCHDAQRFKAFSNMARHSKADRARLVKILEQFHKEKQNDKE